MKKYILIGVILCLFYSCTGGSSSTVAPNPNEYQNLIILSDLSSRVDNKSIKDFEEIDKIIEYFSKECVKPGVKSGDKSSLRFATLSGNEIFGIDVGKFEHNEKQKYVNSTDKFKDNGFNSDLIQFKKDIESHYVKARVNGLDLISILLEKIKSRKLIKEVDFKVVGSDTVFTRFNNKIFLFTDGYLEYHNKNVNSQFYFGAPEIEKVRKFCISNKMDVRSALQREPSLGLMPVKFKENGLVELYLKETHERDKDETTQTYKNSIGLRDNEILEAVWEDWAMKSGFKAFFWEKY